MSKGIELTQSQIKAYERGATMFLFPISDEAKALLKKEDWIYADSPIQKGDKDIFVQEEFTYSMSNILYKSKQVLRDRFFYNNCIVWKPASEMTKEQSRFTFSECIDVKVVKVQDIEIDELEKMDNIHITSLFQEMGINRTYKDNDYVFSVEFK